MPKATEPHNLPKANMRPRAFQISHPFLHVLRSCPGTAQAGSATKGSPGEVQLTLGTSSTLCQECWHSPWFGHTRNGSPVKATQVTHTPTGFLEKNFFKDTEEFSPFIAGTLSPVLSLKCWSHHPGLLLYRCSSSLQCISRDFYQRHGTPTIKWK